MAITDDRWKFRNDLSANKVVPTSVLKIRATIAFDLVRAQLFGSQGSERARRRPIFGYLERQEATRGVAGSFLSLSRESCLAFR